MSWPHKAPLIIVSDIHLHHCEDVRGQSLLALVNRLETLDLDYFVLLGDIFDFGLGSSNFYRKKFAPIGEALAKLARSGTEVIFFEGNHEFNLKRFGWKDVRIIESGDYILELNDGTKIKFAHGDMIYPSKVYAAFRQVVKSAPVKEIASLIPGMLLDRLTLKSAEISRAQDDMRTMDHAGLIQTANAWLDKDHCHHGIFGHFHVPYAEPRMNASGTILSLDCWDKPNFLMYKEGEFCRGFLEENNQLRLEAAQPILAQLLAKT